jgi:hypothetical protein
MRDEPDPCADEMPAAKWAITPAMLGFAVGIAAVSFAFPIYRVTKMYLPASLYFLAGWPQWEFLGSLVLSLMAALAVVIGLCLAAGFVGGRAETTERALAAALVLETVLVVTTRYAPGPIAGVPLALAGAGVFASGTRLLKIARAVLWRFCLILALGWFGALGYNVAATALSSRAAAAPRFIETPPSDRIIIVLLFDELDEELLFRLRPERVAIPNPEKFDSEALHATRVSSVARMTTVVIPELLTGRVLDRAEPRSPQLLELYGLGGTRTAWDARDTIFAKVRTGGLNSAVLGWHHPYCRVLASVVAACETYPNVDATISSRIAFYYGQKGVTVFPPFVNPVRIGIGRQYEAVAREQYSQFLSGRRRLASWIADRRIGLIWAHLPVPHPPGMVPINAGRGPANYFDNLALVDDTVGAVTKELKRTGRWDHSVVVITGDHGLRPDIWRERPGWTGEEDRLIGLRARESVPLMVHLPGQTEHVSFDEPVSALVLYDLVLEWSQGRLLEPGTLVSELAGRVNRP